MRRDQTKPNQTNNDKLNQRSPYLPRKLVVLQLDLMVDSHLIRVSVRFFSCLAPELSGAGAVLSSKDFYNYHFSSWSFRLSARLFLPAFSTCWLSEPTAAGACSSWGGGVTLVLWCWVRPKMIWGSRRQHRSHRWLLVEIAELSLILA